MLRTSLCLLVRRGCVCWHVVVVFAGTSWLLHVPLRRKQVACSHRSTPPHCLQAIPVWRWQPKLSNAEVHHVLLVPSLAAAGYPRAIRLVALAAARMQRCIMIRAGQFRMPIPYAPGASGALRLAALAAAKGGGGPEGVEPPEAVVMAVRRMRAERDELRRRDAKLRKQLNDARTTLKVGAGGPARCKDGCRLRNALQQLQLKYNP
eukprot:1149422-Pelagomonas_calceolata.AAC.8